MGAGNPVLRRAAWSHLSSPFFVFPRNPHNKPGMVVCPCAVLGKQRQEGLNSYPAQPGWCAPGSWEILPLKVDRAWGMALKVSSVFTYGYEPIQNVHTHRGEKNKKKCVWGGKDREREKEERRAKNFKDPLCFFQPFLAMTMSNWFIIHKGNEKKKNKIECNVFWNHESNLNKIMNLNRLIMAVS